MVQFLADDSPTVPNGDGEEKASGGASLLLNQAKQGRGDEGHGLDHIRIEQKYCRLEAEGILDRGRRQLDR